MPESSECALFWASALMLSVKAIYPVRVNVPAPMPAANVTFVTQAYTHVSCVKRKSLFFFSFGVCLFFFLGVSQVFKKRTRKCMVRNLHFFL